MVFSIIGLIASGLLYLSTIYAFVWAGERRVQWAARHGLALGPAPTFPSAAEIWRRHGVEMTIIYGAFFVALALAGFPLWQRAAIAGLAALVFGSFWIANSAERIRLDVASPTRRSASSVGYWCLSVADWCGYMGVLCFGTALLVEVF